MFLIIMQRSLHLEHTLAAIIPNETPRANNLIENTIYMQGLTHNPVTEGETMWWEHSDVRLRAVSG